MNEHLYDSHMTDDDHVEGAGDRAPSTGDDGCDGVLATIAGQLNLVNAHLTQVAATLLANDGWRQGAKKSPEAFLAWKLGMSSERAKLVVRVAKHRDDFPTLVAAFDRGELSLEQMAEAVRAPAWADADVFDFVRISTVTKIRRAVRSDMFEGDPDQPAPPRPEPKDRVSFGIGRDGRWRLSANLSIDEGRRVEAALTERKDVRFADGDEDVTWPEAMIECFDRSLGSVESESRRDRFRTWLHFDVTNGVTTTTDGWRIPMAVRDRLLCDGVVEPVWERDGKPFSVGLAQRIVPDRTRRIIEKRDRGCRVPGCNADRFVEIHHIIHWQDGGPTDTWNLISVCPQHHKMHHDGLLGIDGNADEFDGVTFTDADGTVITGSSKPAPAADIPTPAATYIPPLNGRFDWNWIGLGWIHPNALERRKQQMSAHWDLVDRRAA
jgi:hypothetical protein